VRLTYGASIVLFGVAGQVLSLMGKPAWTDDKSASAVTNHNRTYRTDPVSQGAGR